LGGPARDGDNNSAKERSIAERSTGANMSKARDTRKDTKKKPAKSLLEKRAAKREKKAGRPFRV